MIKLRLPAYLLLLIACPSLQAQVNPSWSEPFPPFKIIGNVYYVGSKGLASYLITTPKGNILINSSLVQSVPLIEDSIQKLGFRFEDTGILLISHAHYDHCAGSDLIKHKTHAVYMVMEGDVRNVESGGHSDFQYGESSESWYPPTKVDIVLRDGDKVNFGGVVLTAHLTPGHTQGCTTWTMQVSDTGKLYDVVIVGSPNVNPGYKLVGNKQYPNIAKDYARGFRTLEALRCDVFLGAHGDYFGLLDKFPRLKAGQANPFVDPAGYRTYIEERRQAFQNELQKQLVAARH